MIRFCDKQWDKLKKNYDLWWAGALQRPLMPIVLAGVAPNRDKPKNALLACVNVNDFSVTPEQIIDRYDYELSCYEYLEDSFPHMHMMQYGPGVISAFMGAKLLNSNDTVWFEPVRRVPLEDLHFEYDPDNLWLRRVKDIYRAGMKKWGGEVIMSMPDLGGIMDVLAVFRSSEDLLFDLYDSPEEVKRLVRELHDMWFLFFNEINDILKGSRGYSDWGTIYSEKPSYMLQSDFSFMIGPDMFNEFVAEELDLAASKLTHAFYHLDGVGELPHLERLLQSKTICGIQWVPGCGAAAEQDWSEVYHRISKAGKKIQVQFGLDQYPNILNSLERPDDLTAMQMTYPLSERNNVLQKRDSIVKKYGN